MCDCMTFPDTVDEFMEKYKVVDTDGIYMSKGAELVPIFRMRQWFEHIPSAQPEQQWIPCNARLPKENVYVLVWCGEVRIARLIRGISKEQRAKMQEGAIDDPVSYGWNLSNGYFKVKRSESYRACDENGNNKVPYCWDSIYGEMFGQDVKAWMPLPEPYREVSG